MVSVLFFKFLGKEKNIIRLITVIFCSIQQSSFFQKIWSNLKLIYQFAKFANLFLIAKNRCFWNEQILKSEPLRVSADAFSCDCFMLFPRPRDNKRIRSLMATRKSDSSRCTKPSFSSNKKASYETFPPFFKIKMKPASPEELFCVICSASQVLSQPTRILKRHQVKQTNHSYSPECSQHQCFRVFFEHDELKNRNLSLQNATLIENWK